MTTIKKGNIDIIYKSKDSINLSANDVPFYKGRKFISGNDKSTCTVYELGPISPTSNSETNRHISYIEAVVKNNTGNTNGEVSSYGFYIYISEKASEDTLQSIIESATLSSPYKLSNNCVFLQDYGTTEVDNTKIGLYNSLYSKSYNYRSQFYEIRNLNDNEYDILSIVINPGYTPNQQVDISDGSTTVQFYMNKVLIPMLSDLQNRLDPYWSTQYIKDPYIYIILFPITTNEESISPSSLQILQFNTTYDRYIYKDLAFMCGSQEWESSKLPEVSEPAYFPIDYPGNVCTINQSDMINSATYDNLIGPEIFMQSCVVTDLYDKLFSAEIEYKLTSDAGKLCVLFGSFKEDNSAIDWFRENTEFSSSGAYRTYYNPNKVNFGIYGNTFSFEEVFDTYAIFSISFDSWTSGQRTFTEYIEIKPINGDKAVARNNTQQQAGTGEVYKLYFKFYKGIPESSYPGFGFKVYYELTDSTRHELGNLYLFQQAAGTNGVQGVFSNPRTFICAYPGTNDINKRLTLDHMNRMKVNWGTRPYVLPKLYGSVFEQSVPSVSSTNTKWKSMFYYNRRYNFTGKNDNLVILPYNLMETDEDSIFLEAVFPPTGNYNVMYWVIIGSNIGYDFDPTSIETTTQMVTNLQDGVIVAVDSSKTSANLYEMQFVSGNKIVNAGGLTIDDGGQQDGITACLFRDGTNTSSTASVIIRAKHDADSTQKMEGNEWDKLKTIVIQAQYLGESSTVTDSTDLGWVELNFGPTAKHPANQELIDQLLDNDNGGGAVTLNDLGIGDNYVTDGSYKLIAHDEIGSGSKQYSVKFRIKINNAPDSVSTSDISLLSWEVTPSNTMNGLTFINSARISSTLSSWDSGTGYMSGYISLTVNNYFPTYLGSYTFNLTISYKNDPNNTATGSFGFDFGEKSVFGAIPSGKIFQLNSIEDIYDEDDEVFDNTLSTFVEHSYESNNSVIYIADNEQYLLEQCPVDIWGKVLFRTKARATITFTLQDQDTGYMDTIIEKYAEGFDTCYMTIDDLTGIMLRIINGSTKDSLDSFAINKLSSSKFELIMTCTEIIDEPYMYYEKGTRYEFGSYSRVSFSVSNFGSDIYLALMRAKVDTKLEFTIIGTVPDQ